MFFLRTSSSCICGQMWPPHLGEGELDLSVEGLSCIKQGFNEVRSRFGLRAWFRRGVQRWGRGGLSVMGCAASQPAAGRGCQPLLPGAFLPHLWLAV